MADDYRPRVLPMLLVFGVLTLVVTVVRLVGELQGWDSNWFSTEAGSPMNPFGIVWLVPVAGLLFGRRLAQGGGAPTFVAGFFVPMFGFLALMVSMFIANSYFEGGELLEVMGYLMLGAPVLSLLALFVWPRAFVAMVAYWLLARVPVMLIQYLDIQNGWQTHYGKVPAEFAGADADARIWMLTKAQLCIWMAFTVLLGCAFAAIGAATVRRR